MILRNWKFPRTPELNDWIDGMVEVHAGNSQTHISAILLNMKLFIQTFALNGVLCTFRYSNSQILVLVTQKAP